MDIVGFLFPKFSKTNTMAVRLGRVVQFMIYAPSGALIAFVLIMSPFVVLDALGRYDPVDKLIEAVAAVIGLILLGTAGLALGRGVRYVLSDE